MCTSMLLLFTSKLPFTVTQPSQPQVRLGEELTFYPLLCYTFTVIIRHYCWYSSNSHLIYTDPKVWLSDTQVHIVKEIKFITKRSVNSMFIPSSLFSQRGSQFIDNIFYKKHSSNSKRKKKNQMFIVLRPIHRHTYNPAYNPAVSLFN